MTVVAALMAVFFIMQLVGQVPAALWVIFGEDRFHWDATTIGISLAAFGILHSLAQAMITGPVAARLGERRALMLGMIADGTGYILLAFATRGWMAFPIMVLLASGGIGMPALQAMLSRQVDEERQGQLQGSLAALTSLTSIVGPLLFTAIYAASITTWNGWAWIAGAALYLLCLRRCVAGFGAAQGNEPIADRGNDRPMPCGSRRLPASYTRPRSAVGTLAQPDTPDHEQDADDLKRTQRLIQEQPS